MPVVAKSTAFGRTVQYDSDLFAEMDGKQRPMDNIVWTSNTEIGKSDIGHPAPGCPHGPSKYKIDYVLAHHWRGGGLQSTTQEGTIFDSIAHHNYWGATLFAPDSEVSRCILYDNRDFNLWIKRDAGNCQSLMNHLYGGRFSLFVQGGWAFRSNQDTIADATIGGLSYGWQESYVNTTFQHNTIRDMLLLGHTQSMVNPILNSQLSVDEFRELIIPSGDIWSGGFSRSVYPYEAGVRCKVAVEMGLLSSIRGGCLNMDPWWHPAHTPLNVPTEGIWVNYGASGCTIDTTINDYQDKNGAVLVRLQGDNPGTVIRLVTRGGMNPNSRLLVSPGTVSLHALIVVTDNGTSAIPGTDPVEYYPAKDLDGLINLGSGWTGDLQVLDAAQGIMYRTGDQITEGQSI